MTGVAYGSVPFREQIEFFRRKPNVLTESYLDVFGAEHDHAFMVAGANRIDVLADFRVAIDRAISQGGTLEEFRRDFDRIVQTHGWDYNGGRNWRSRVIYETNLRQSYNAGRWEQLQRLKDVRPFWRYRHSDAVENPRPHHLAWDGMVLHADDQWWLYHYPANGYGCQCWVEGLNARDLQRLGKTGPDKAPPTVFQEVTIGVRSASGPRVVRTPVGVDPGFGYAPGRSAGQVGALPSTPPSMSGVLQQAMQSLLQKSTRLPAAPAAQLLAETMALPRAGGALSAGFEQWATLTAPFENGRYLIGAIDQDLLRSLQSHSLVPFTAAIEVAAAAASRRVGAPMPAVLRDAAAVLLDVRDRSLLFVSPPGDFDQVQLAVAFGTRDTEANAAGPASLADLGEIRAAIAAGRLVLLRGSLG